MNKRLQFFLTGPGFHTGVCVCVFDGSDVSHLPAAAAQRAVWRLRSHNLTLSCEAAASTRRLLLRMIQNVLSEQIRSSRDELQENFQVLSSLKASWRAFYIYSLHSVRLNFCLGCFWLSRVDFCVKTVFWSLWCRLTRINCCTVRYF